MWGGRTPHPNFTTKEENCKRFWHVVRLCNLTGLDWCCCPKWQVSWKSRQAVSNTGLAVTLCGRQGGRVSHNQVSTARFLRWKWLPQKSILSHVVMNFFPLFVMPFAAILESSPFSSGETINKQTYKILKTVRQEATKLIFQQIKNIVWLHNHRKIRVFFFSSVIQT